MGREAARWRSRPTTSRPTSAAWSTSPTAPTRGCTSYGSPARRPGSRAATESEIARNEDAMPRVTGLGHVGIYVRDLERMVAFYRDVMGMQITKQNWRAGVVFLSADPDTVDHEIALMRGRPEGADPHLIQQISMRAASLDDLRAFHRRLVAEDYRIEEVVNHASAIGCYFFDPEGNRTEVFWVTGRPCWVPTVSPIDIHQSDEAVLAEVDRVWKQLRDVPVGGRMTEESATL